MVMGFMRLSTSGNDSEDAFNIGMSFSGYILVYV